MPNSYTVINDFARQDYIIQIAAVDLWNKTEYNYSRGQTPIWLGRKQGGFF